MYLYLKESSRNYVHFHFNFPTIDKTGARIKFGGGGWKIFRKFTCVEGGYSVLQSRVVAITVDLGV